MADLTPPPSQQATITYNVGELLDKMRNEQNITLARIETKLDGKADKADVSDLSKDLEVLSVRTTKLETADRERTVADQTRRSHLDAQAAIKQQRWNYVLALMSILAILGSGLFVLVH